MYPRTAPRIRRLRAHSFSERPSSPDSSAYTEIKDHGAVKENNQWRTAPRIRRLRTNLSPYKMERLDSSAYTEIKGVSVLPTPPAGRQLRVYGD